MKTVEQFIRLVFMLLSISIYSVKAEGASRHGSQRDNLRPRLLGHWFRQENGVDAEGRCIIDNAVEFRADGTFLYTRTFHPVEHRQPTWDCLANPGTWRLEHSTIVQRWDGNGEHADWITRWPLRRLTKNRLVCLEGTIGAVSYRRTDGPR